MVLLGDGSQGQVFRVSRGANGSPWVQDPFGGTSLPPNSPKPKFWDQFLGFAVLARSLGQAAVSHVGPICHLWSLFGWSWSKLGDSDLGTIPWGPKKVASLCSQKKAR